MSEQASVLLTSFSASPTFLFWFYLQTEHNILFISTKEKPQEKELCLHMMEIRTLNVFLSLWSACVLN